MTCAATMRMSPGLAPRKGLESGGVVQGEASQSVRDKSQGDGQRVGRPQGEDAGLPAGVTGDPAVPEGRALRPS